jgi:hypothetical protein
MTFKLLSSPTSNPKTAKNTGYGVLTAPLHLAPFNLSGYQVCPMASQGCAKACLHTAGNPAFMKNKEIARIRKTKMFFENREQFLNDLVQDITKLEKQAQVLGLKCGVRLNATSDIQFEAFPVSVTGVKYNNIMLAFPNIQFYDYTKIHKRLTKALPSNYHLTFSRAETNHANAINALNNGFNVAFVFSGVSVKAPLPETYMGFKVINGDLHDYRPADDLEKVDNKGVIVGLKAKGKARKDTSGFTVNPFETPMEQSKVA